jgi:hypothetical protein
MPPFTRTGLMLGLSLLAFGCASDNSEDAQDSSVINTQPVVDAGAASHPDSSVAAAPDAGGITPVVDSSVVTPLDSSVAPRDSGNVTTSDAGSTDAAITTTDAATGDATVAAGGTSLTGTLGALGPVKPTVTGFVISNSGETLVYLTSAPLTCAKLMMSRWLGSFTADAQVVEIVIKGAPKVGTAVTVGGFVGGEVNYAAGGKSSAYEVTAASGSITFTKSEPMGVVEGTVMATYAMGSVMGTFHAEFCAGGQGY